MRKTLEESINYICCLLACIFQLSFGRIWTMIRVFELHHNLQNIENVVASLLGIGSLGIGEALELPCTLQTSGEFWNFVPLVYNWFESLWTSLQYANKWAWDFHHKQLEFWVGSLGTSSQIVRILATISLVIIMWWMSFFFSCSLYVFLYQSCLQHVFFYFNIVWKRTYLITIPFLGVEYSHIKFCHLF